jgi:hypothetical protein
VSLSEQNAQQVAAEEIRCHLVLLRGGAPFLSSSDATLLQSWLETGVAVSSILHAIEAASEARRKRRSRIPLTLKQANKHLKKFNPSPTPKSFFNATASTEHPLSTLAEKLPDQGSTASQTDALLRLSEALLTLPCADLEQLSREASQLFRSFLEERWRQLPPDMLESEKQSAREELTGLAEHLTESKLAGLVEEVVRDRLRQQYPLLCSSALSDTLRT